MVLSAKSEALKEAANILSNYDYLLVSHYDTDKA